jgi:hypothetical protein
VSPGEPQGSPRRAQESPRRVQGTPGEPRPRRAQARSISRTAAQMYEDVLGVYLPGGARAPKISPCDRGRHGRGHIPRVARVTTRARSEGFELHFLTKAKT